MSSAAERGSVFAAAVVVLGIGVWYVWTNEGKTHNSTLAETVFGDVAYNPYVWWTRHDGAAAAYHHEYPDTVAPNCAKVPYASEYGSLSVALAGGDEDG